MKSRIWIWGAALGVVASLVLAGVMTYADWRLNPAGIFHGEQGTNWTFVRETFISWFVPTIPAAVILAIAVLFLVSPKGDK